MDAHGESSALVTQVVGQEFLAKKWDTTHRQTSEDWHSWIHALQVELLKQSPRRELRKCDKLAQRYPPVAAELFNVV